MHFLKVNAFEGCMSRVEGTLIINCSYLISITEQYWDYQHSSIKTLPQFLSDCLKIHILDDIE